MLQSTPWAPKRSPLRRWCGCWPSAVGSRSRLVRTPPSAALLAARMAGWLVRDVVLTKDELDGLMAGLLVSADPPTASTRFTEWLEAEGASLGLRYASELTRHYR